jgi:hypothetical protein
MTKSAKKPGPARSQGPAPAAKTLTAGKEDKTAMPPSVASGLHGSVPKESDGAGPKRLPKSTSKQARVLSMLGSSTGATIAAMMHATGWQQHSVRGFLAGVVRKRLKLKLTSKKISGTRVYQLAGGADAKRQSGKSKRRAG